MSKLVKQKYNNVDGTRKVYSYLLAIPKTKVIEAGLDPDKEIKIVIDKKKLVITN